MPTARPHAAGSDTDPTTTLWHSLVGLVTGDDPVRVPDAMHPSALIRWRSCVDDAEAIAIHAAIGGPASAGLLLIPPARERRDDAAVMAAVAADMPIGRAPPPGTWIDAGRILRGGGSPWAMGCREVVDIVRAADPDHPFLLFAERSRTDEEITRSVRRAGIRRQVDDVAALWPTDAVPAKTDRETGPWPGTMSPETTIAVLAAVPPGHHAAHLTACLRGRLAIPDAAMPRLEAVGMDIVDIVLAPPSSGRDDAALTAAIGGMAAGRPAREAIAWIRDGVVPPAGRPGWDLRSGLLTRAAMGERAAGDRVVDELLRRREEGPTAMQVLDGLPPDIAPSAVAAVRGAIAARVGPDGPSDHLLDAVLDAALPLDARCAWWGMRGAIGLIVAAVAGGAATPFPPRAPGFRPGITPGADALAIACGRLFAALTALADVHGARLPPSWMERAERDVRKGRCDPCAMLAAAPCLAPLMPGDPDIVAVAGSLAAIPGVDPIAAVRWLARVSANGH